MPTREELDQLSSAELHDRAMSVAKRHADVRFLWKLLRAVPAAEASTGHLNEAENDVFSLFGHLDDLRKSGEGDIADALRPLYLDYLEKHG